MAILCFLILHYLLFKKPHGRFPRNWPVLRMLPSLLMSLHRLCDYSVEILEISDLTFLFKGPPFFGMDMLLTVNPANIHHIMSSNFSNYIKGSEFQDVFDVFGDGIITTDSELWKNLRKSYQAMVHHQEFQRFSMSTVASKLKDGLVPLLDHFAEEGTIVDLQDLFGRLTFDTILILITGTDPRSLSIEMHEDELAKALDDVGEGVLYRHVKPRFLWKLQNLLGLGQEKKMIQANATFDRVCSRYISAKREEITRSQGVLDTSNGEREDLLSSFMKLDTTKYKLLKPSDNKFLRDTILAFILAGRDTTASALSWFFWLLSENPQVLAKIRQEIIDNDLPRTGNGQENLDKLVYLQGALLEAMRLYPPVSFGRKSSVQPDVLPSGHKVDANSKIIICLYALGRMKAVWGEDALQFKPERWICENGSLKHEPSSKFLAFNSGPRTCLGKHLAIIQMKMVAVEILQNYDVKVIKGQKIEPVLGVLVRLHRIYDCSVEVLENSNLTFQFKGPWFSGMDILATVDPANIHYILSSKFSNYIKGPEFQEIFEAYGDGIINSDSELWRSLRKSSQVIFSHQKYQNFSTSTTRSKLKDGLLPLLSHFADEEMVLDLQDVFQRFMFDITFIFITGSDPGSLSIEMPEVEFAKALDDVGEAIVYRHITPRFLWKLQKGFGIGTEKNMMKANAVLDRVCAKYISAKREEIRSQGITHNSDEESGEDLLTSHIKLDTSKYELLNPEDDKFLRDFTVGFMAAGRDSTACTLTWFFWILSENPNVLTKILQEINENVARTRSDVQDKNKLVYLHAALSESMRLYPPIPFERKSPIKPDVLPSGHKVKSNINIMIFLYAMGRMKDVWGEDAAEFKPERWISETGGLRHEPSYKFLSFNAGPRTCLGKNLAMDLMKTVIVEILQAYEINVVHGQKIEPKPGLILHMKHGLKVTVAKKYSTLE
ncbi:hypothetical protein Bca101_015693 [Brassica carinata]